MASVFHQIGLLCVAALLVWTIVSDVRTYTIPNWLTLTVALLAVPFWFVGGLDVWPDMASRFAISLAIFLAFAGLFTLGMMGGGDVKLIGALALWLPFGALFQMLFLMALIGGAVTLMFVIRHRIAKRAGPPQIPYGVAIASSGLWVLVEPFLNHSGA